MRLGAIPRAGAFVTVTAVTVVGLVLGGAVGFVLLLLVAALLGWLASLTWPVLTGQARLLRVIAIAVLVAAAAVRLVR